MVELTLLRNQRKGHRAYATRIIKKAEDIIKSIPANEEELSELKVKLLAYRNTLTDKGSVLKGLHEEILAQVTEEQDIEDEIFGESDFHSVIQEIQIRMEQWLIKHASKDKHEEETLSVRSVNSESSCFAKLPQIQLKRFDGNPINFQTFWDSFDSAIHKNNKLDDITKFNYLNSLLDKSAAKAIKGLTLTSENYVNAVKILNERFGDHQVIITANMDALLALKSISSSRDIQNLRSIYDTIEIHARNLENYDVNSEHYGPILISIIMNKLPDDFRLDISRLMPPGKWELKKLLDTFKNELTSREKCFYMSNKNNSEYEYSENFSASALHVGNNKSFKISCCYCKMAHPSNQCHTVTDVSARKSILQQKKKCFNCLRTGHIVKICQKDSKCYSCGGKHHISICEKKSYQGNSTFRHQSKDQYKRNSQPYDHNNTEPPGFTSNNSSTLLINNNSGHTLLQTAKAWISSPMSENALMGRVLFDNCSQQTFLSERVRNKLNLPTSRKEKIMVKAFGSTEHKLQILDVVALKIQGLNSNRFNTIEALVVPTICSPLSSQTIDLAKEQYPHIQNLSLADTNIHNDDLNVDILIGANYYWNFITGAIKRGDNGPVAVDTTLGWVLNGSIESVKSHNKVNVNLSSSHVLKVSCTTQDQEPLLNLQQSFNKFWEIESTGIESKEADNLLDESAKKIKFNGERYETPLPWKQSHDTLPDNYVNSKNRLLSLMKRLRKNPELFKEYDNIIKEQEKEGIIEQTPENHTTVPGQVHYLPHHPVVREDKETSKVRIVYDASSKQHGQPSLNDCLETGPNLLPQIIDVLIRFRSNKIGLISDIKKAFLNVGIRAIDRDVLRFLWVNDINVVNPEIIIRRFTRVIFGSTSSQFLLNATIYKLINQYKEIDVKFVNKVLKELYVDDLISGDHKANELFIFYTKVKKRMLDGGLQLRKWQTNDTNLQKRINQAEGDNSIINTKESKVLGVNWNLDQDNLTVDLHEIYQTSLDVTPTKRNILKLIATVYDPLGIMSPIIMSFKVLFQQLCLSNYGWDDKINGELLSRWFKLRELFQTNLTVPRFYFSGYNLNEIKNINMHGFCDASKNGYAAVIYITGHTSKKELIGNFVIAKTKVSPIKKVSIPRMELLACMLLSQLVEKVKNSISDDLKFKRVTCWSDSLDSVHWIKGDKKKWPLFIENRVNAIRRVVPPLYWRHCPGTLNPADLPSRGINKVEINPEVINSWLNAPSFVYNENDWPPDKSNISVNLITENNVEEDTENAAVIKEELSRENLYPKKCLLIANIIKLEDYSNIDKLYRITSYVLRFINNISSKLNKNSKYIHGHLTLDEIIEAKVHWLFNVQKVFTENDKYSNQLKKVMGIYFDEDNVLRCKGRLNKSELSSNCRNPILLPKHGHFTFLIIKQAHENVQHGGSKDTLTEVRSKYWVIQGRSIVSSFIRKCVFPCNRLESKPFRSQIKTDLPLYRVTSDFCFQSTGVDYLGPLYVKQVYTENDDNMYKVEVVLYTCAATRAVHLDLVPDLSAGAFIRSLKRFISRRGAPKLFISDNATCFKNEELKLSEEMLLLKIKWKYIVEAAPWWGGFYERLVGSVKRSLRKILFRSTITYEELLTVIAEIEGILNSRPLCYHYSDEVEEDITPSHLFSGRRLLTPYINDTNQETTLNQVKLSKRIRYIKELINCLWKRWQNEYLTSLREFQTIGTNQKRIKEGDIVVIHNHQAKRSQWRLGKIIELITGEDLIPRAAKVKVINQNGTNVIKRPISKLYPLEINANLEVSEIEKRLPVTENSNESIDESDEIRIRPSRSTADTGILIRRLTEQS